MVGQKKTWGFGKGRFKGKEREVYRKTIPIETKGGIQT